MFKNVSMGPSDHSKNQSITKSSASIKEESKTSKNNDKDKAESNFNV